MKNYLLFLIILAIVISVSSTYNAYAVDSNTLSFDSQTKIVIEHSSYITCYNCPAVTGDTISATLSDGLGTSLPVTLIRTPGTNNFLSPFVKFTTTVPTGGLYFLTSVQTPPRTITATATGLTNGQATIVGTYPNLTSLPDYNVNSTSITPNSKEICGGPRPFNDDDGDGICNNWEDPTLFPANTECSGKKGLCIQTSPSVVPYFLECIENANDFRNACPSRIKADIYVEIDWMIGHKPADNVISAVEMAFENSNYKSINQVDGITFHAQIDEELPHVDSLLWNGNAGNPGFDQLKRWWFGTYNPTLERNYNYPTDVAGDWNNYKRSQKGQVFHYVIFGHKQQGSSTSSGISESPGGNDSFISLGSFDGGVGNKDQQKGTLLHEIGHQLTLAHGGNDNIGCKPNYLSVMSYTRQFTDYVSNRQLSFSKSKLDTLNENSGLVEDLGVTPNDPTGSKTVYGPLPKTETFLDVPVDWDKDSILHETSSSDINNFSIGNCNSSPNQTLDGFKDWDESKLVLSPHGIASTSGEGDCQCLDLASEKYNQVIELSAEDVTNMRISRIDSILYAIDRIPDSDIVGDPRETRPSYQKDLNDIKQLLMQNYRGENTMIDAYNKMISFQKRLDGLSDHQIIKSDSEYLKNVNTLVSDVILSQSISIVDFDLTGKKIKIEPIVLPTTCPFTEEKNNVGICIPKSANPSYEIFIYILIIILIIAGLYIKKLKKEIKKLLEIEVPGRR